jgi:hypothetical protein
MDANRFDALTRSFASRSLVKVRSRRRALGLTLAAVLSPVSRSQHEDVSARGKCEPRCGECLRCKKGKCRKTKHGKKCKKGKCLHLGDGTPCSNHGTCQGGTCVVPFCAGKNTCTDPVLGGSRCGQGDTLCYCHVTTTGEPFCGKLGGAGECPGSGCPAGQTCVSIVGGTGNCSPPPFTRCKEPCSNPL